MNVAEAFDKMDYGHAPESADLARDWLDGHGRRFQHFVNGRWHKPAGNRWFDSYDPSTGAKLAKISFGSQKDIEAAVRAAARAQAAWSDLSGHERAKYLYAIARGLQRESRIFAVLETMDNGKPIRESRDIDVPAAARHFYHHVGWAQLLETEFAGLQPLGVVGAIIPWNFPLLMLAWKLAPALAAGNTVVLKPAEYTSLTALRFAELCMAVGLPKGVVNVVTGDGRTGERIVKHPKLHKIAFTGSTEVGRRIRELTAGSGKHLTLELGGKSPFLVFDDADLDSAVEGVVDAIWFNQGQVCCAGSRLLVQETIADEFIRRLKHRMAKLRVGDPLDKSVDIGAIVAPVQLQRVDELVAAGKAEGCRIWQPKWVAPKDGWFYPPTLFTEVSTAATIAQEEIFGPVLISMTFRTPSEAVALANNTRYGLAASVWSENANLALDVARKIDCGVVWINCTNQFDGAAGFGGNRESGFGREGGREGMFEYLKPRPTRPAPNRPVNRKTSKIGVGIDRTAKLYIGGKQARPDSGYTMAVNDCSGAVVATVGLGNRKDIRNAVEAARAASSWTSASAHNRAQVLFYLAENLDARRQDFRRRLSQLTGDDARRAAAEVDLAIRRLFDYAAWADKFDGAVHGVPIRGLVLTVHEPRGVIGIVCPDRDPLLSMISLAAPALAMGNSIVLVPSPAHALIATDFYQVLETSDMPAGSFNIVTGDARELSETLADHDDVDALWYLGPDSGRANVEKRSAGNLKPVWTIDPAEIDWRDDGTASGKAFLRRAVNVKNIWIPHGE